MNSGFSARAVSPLTATISDPLGGRINNGTTFRRYRASITFEIPDRQATLSRARSIFYEVGRRHTTVRDLLAPYGEAVTRIDCSVDINPAEAANFEGVARKYSNFSPQWIKMDLAGVAERLALGVVGMSVFGGINSNALRGGAPVRVVALNTLDSPQTASSSSVFIPRTVDTVGNDSVFAVLCAAVNGCGASVTTDVVRLDANTNQPIVPAVEGAPFAGACVEALRVMGANMEASGAGDLFAYAVTRGIHRGLSVVAHTDEGGFMRDLLRYDGFRVPYGGINQALRHYPALPPLAATSTVHIAAWCDAIALKTAAAVSHCDPLVPGQGGLYPTVFTSAAGALSPAGTDETGVTDDDARVIGRHISADLGRFAPLYMRALTQLFGLASISGVAESHFCTAAAGALSQGTAVNRHLRHKTVAPYFWIEPTTLIDKDQFGYPAEMEGYGAKVTPGHTAAEPLFEKVREINPGSNSNHSTIAFKMRSARTSGVVCAYATEPAVLTDLKLYQFDSASIVLAGDQGPTNGDVPTKHAAADPLSSYLWVRGQSCLPAPAEFINVQGNYGARLKQMTWDDNGDAELSDLPDVASVLTGCITYRCTIPTGLPSGASNYADRNARRARSRAAIALTQALVRARGYGEAATPVMEVSEIAPDFGDTPRPMVNENEAVGTEDPGITTTLAQGYRRQPAIEARGAPLPPVAHHEVQRAPPLRQNPALVAQAVAGVAPGPLPPIAVAQPNEDAAMVQAGLAALEIANNPADQGAGPVEAAPLNQ